MRIYKGSTAFNWIMSNFNPQVTLKVKMTVYEVVCVEKFGMMWEPGTIERVGYRSWLFRTTHPNFFPGTIVILGNTLLADPLKAWRCNATSVHHGTSVLRKTKHLPQNDAEQHWTLSSSLSAHTFIGKVCALLHFKQEEPNLFRFDRSKKLHFLDSSLDYS